MFNKMKLELEPTETLMARRGLGMGRSVQKYIDSEVLRLNDPLVPKDTGELIRSGIRSTVLGQGEVVYRTPYARKIYYGKEMKFHEGATRGAYWFERMKASNKEKILNGAKKLAGAE